MAATTHGIKEEAVALAEQCGPILPRVNPKAVYLKLPLPVMQAETNWPLLTVSKVSRERLK